MHPSSTLTALCLLSVFLLTGGSLLGQSNSSLPGEMEVTCLEDSMEILLNKSGKFNVPADSLRLGDLKCPLYGNGTHVTSNMSLNACGTQMEDDGENLIFINEVVSMDDVSDIIVRDALVEIEFSCKYPKRTNVTLEFKGHRPPVNFTQRGFGTFTLQFDFYDTSAFAKEKDPNTYPLEYDLGEMMYMQIESFSEIPTTELLAETCTAAPSDNPNDKRIYTIIKNGCKVDDTVTIYANGDQSKVKFAMQAFKFIGIYEQVFITCSVVMCKAGMANSRCSKGCINRSKREAPLEVTENLLPSDDLAIATMVASPVGYIRTVARHSIHKRDAPAETRSHFISQGPIRLRRSVGSQVVKEMDPNIVFTLGCFVAAVAMACGVVLYKTWRSNVTYQRMV